MLKARFSFIVIISFVFAATGNAQHIDSILNTLDTKYPQEKIHLHLDKGYYSPGETIWFKAYIANSNFTAPLSTTMYAELLDDKGNMLERKTMPILEAGAASAFDLADSIYPAKVYIRAYTAWMLNFDSSLLCIKAISIIPLKKKTTKQKQADTYTLNFFPEGGDLVENIQSNIAFKVTDQNGRPINVSGTISDAVGKKISNFNSQHDGMGFITLTPSPNEKYNAVWKDKQGVTHTSPIPIAKKQGVVLTVSNMEGKLSYTLSRSEQAGDNLKSLSVIAQVHQQMVYSAKINMSSKTKISAPVDIEHLPPGILQLTVFNADQQPVAERVAFIYGTNDFSFITDLHATEKNMSKRSRSVLQIDVGGSLRSNLSIAVTDAAMNPVTGNEESIISNLLMSSDLKGYIYNPAYYFSSDADSVKQQLDLVMMTNGWRRFKWEDVLASKFPLLRYQPENLLSIKGSVFGLTKNELKGRELTASLKTKTSSSDFFTVPINEDGQFKLNGIYFFDTAKVFYQINADKDKRLTGKASFTFDNNFIRVPIINAAFLQTAASPVQPDSAVIEKSSLLAVLRKSQIEKDKIKTLDIIKVTAKQKPLKDKLDEELTSGLFKGGDGRIFSTEDDPFANSTQNVLTYLQGKVPGLQISTVGQGSVTWRGSATSFFLNESSIDMEQLKEIQMTDVAMVKVFDPPFFGAAGGGAGGAIAVYYKNGKGKNNTAATGLNTATLYGYSPIREFYSPNYDKTNDLSVTDTRITLYWNPFILLDAKKRRVMIPFYNNDDCKKIRVIIEGINEQGQYTREEKIFE